MSKKLKNRQCTIPQILGFRIWFEKRFGECCAEHDTNYVERKISRLAADQRLKICMSKKGYPLLASLTYYGFVRLLGWIWWRT